MSTDSTYKIRALGDVHGQWGDDDARLLESGDQDFTVFVGDLGDENAEIVEDVASVDCELAVILGNHDAWRSFRENGATPALRRSLDALGEDHLAYDVRDLPDAGLSLIGARPFSWGGRDLRSPDLYSDLYGIRTPEESAAKIVEAAERAKFEDLVILAHNGPKGLGKKPADIWGKDFGKSPGGDWGDQDLADALSALRERGFRVRAVIAGHMHDRLMTPRGAPRDRFVRRGGTSFLNVAVVPRIRKAKDGRSLHHFVDTEWRNTTLIRVRELWLDAEGSVVRRVEPEFL
ncbi:MAG: TIGR04168 family protein [Planctomycetota bacterium]